MTVHAPRGLDKRGEIELHRELAGVYTRKYALEFCRLYNDDWNRYLMDQLPCPQDSAVLEVACGVGVLLKDLSKRYKTAVGLDLSLDMLRAAASQEGGRLQVLAADGESLPVRDARWMP